MFVENTIIGVGRDTKLSLIRRGRSAAIGQMSRMLGTQGDGEALQLWSLDPRSRQVAVTLLYFRPISKSLISSSCTPMTLSTQSSESPCG